MLVPTLTGSVATSHGLKTRGLGEKRRQSEERKHFPTSQPPPPSRWSRPSLTVDADPPKDEEHVTPNEKSDCDKNADQAVSTLLGPGEQRH